VVGILKHRDGATLSRGSVGEWRSSDLVRVISTATTHPMVEGDVRLEKKVNVRRRVGDARDFVQLDEITSEEVVCNVCVRCFSSHIEDQRRRYYGGYWSPEVLVRPMPSWRDEDDQPFEVGAACAGFENIRTGELVVLRGPAAKAIWETIRDLEEELGNTLDIEDILKRSLPDYGTHDPERLWREGIDFVKELMRVGLVRPRKILPIGEQTA
jgi:hypothetical protein